MYPAPHRDDLIARSLQSSASLKPDYLWVHVGGRLYAVAMQAPPLEWDTKGEYTRASIELYYLSNAAKPLDADQLTEVRCNDSIGAICRQTRSHGR